MLSSDLVPYLNDYHQCHGSDIFETDITNIDNIKNTVNQYRPDIVVNCSAYTQVDKAESEQDKALMVNATGVQNLAIICKEGGIPLCHISTDYVFDGEKNFPYTPLDNTSPVNFYGHSKLAGEKFIEWINPYFYIIRTSWLYGHHGPNFVKTMIRLSKERDHLNIVHDQIGSPTWTVSLSKAIKTIVESRKFGIYHVTDKTEGSLSWYDFACEIFNQRKIKINLTPITTAQYPTPAKRPKYSVLDLTLTELAVNFTPLNWNDALNKYQQHDSFTTYP